MKSLFLIFILAGSAYADFDSDLDTETRWDYRAWSWLCGEVGKGRTNQQIAETLIVDLELSFTPKKYSVFVTDQDGKISIHISV